LIIRQMMRVISSPSSSTIGFATLIFAMSVPPRVARALLAEAFDRRQ
jgi:hypothetical protein